MAQGCSVAVPEDFVVALLTRPNLRARYQQYAFADYIRSQPQLRRVSDCSPGNASGRFEGNPSDQEGQCSSGKASGRTGGSLSP